MILGDEKVKNEKNVSRLIPRFAPVEDPHWVGGNDTIHGHCEDGYVFVSNPRVKYGGYCRKIPQNKKVSQGIEIGIENIKKLINEARDSGYPVVSLLSDGSIGHYFNKQTREMNNNPRPIITLEKTEVIRYFDEGVVSWDDFVLQYAQEIYDDFDWNAEEQ